MAMDGSLPPVIQWPGPQTLCVVLSSMACFVCKMTKKPASLTNFPQQGDSVAGFVCQLRPTWWLSSVLMQMRLHVELVLGVYEDWAQRVLMCPLSSVQFCLHRLSHWHRQTDGGSWDQGPQKAIALGQCTPQPSRPLTLPSAPTSLALLYLGL